MVPTEALGAIETVKRPKAVPPDSSYARCAGSVVATIVMDVAKRDASAKIGYEKRRGVRRHSSVALVAMVAAAHEIVVLRSGTSSRAQKLSLMYKP